MYESQFEVAFSFSGAQRELVRQVKNYLDTHEIDAFMDENHTVKIWGENLEEVFSHIYSRKSTYYVVFVSKEYTESENTFFEFAAFLKELYNSRESHILPVFLDHTKLKFLPSAGALNAVNLSYKEIGDYIISKIKGEPLSHLLEYLTKWLENNNYSIYSPGEIKHSKDLNDTYLYTNPDLPDCSYRILLKYFKKGNYEKIYIFDSQVSKGVALTFPTGELYNESGNLILLNYGFCCGAYKIVITKENLVEIINNKIN